jgi:hypothetical protein
LVDAPVEPEPDVLSLSSLFWPIPAAPAVPVPPVLPAPAAGVRPVVPVVPLDPELAAPVPVPAGVAGLDPTPAVDGEVPLAALLAGLPAGLVELVVPAGCVAGRGIGSAEGVAALPELVVGIGRAMPAEPDGRVAGGE